MSERLLSLPRLRDEAAATWILVLSGVVFAVSQITILMIVAPLGGPTMLRLQCLGFHASDYISVFDQWQAAGLMPFYRAHLVLDDFHWVWYTVFFTAALARVFNANAVPSRYDGLLLLPLASGLLDWLENHLQHVFLSSPDYATVVDPLTVISSVASNLKWLSAGTYVLLTLVLTLRALRRRAADPRGA
jgi:hypothetical protein